MRPSNSDAFGCSSAVARIARIALATSRGVGSAISIGPPLLPLSSWTVVSLQPPRVFSQKMAAVTDCAPSLVALRKRLSATFAVALMWPVSSSSR